MKKLNISTPITVYDRVEELPQEVRGLMLAAVEIRKTAYAPYSKFHVGTAFLLENGEVRLEFMQNAYYKYLELMSLNFICASEQITQKQIHFRYR